MNMTSKLSKTKFKSGLQCIKKLWFDQNGTIEPTPPSLSVLLRIERGKEVDAKSREGFPGLVLIRAVDQANAAVETTEAINRGASILGQGTFIHNDLSVRIDILERNPENRWNIIEVKMSADVKEEHIPDVSFQKHVLQACGFPVAKCFIMHLNRDCIFPDLSNLFVRKDVTDLVAQYTVDITTHIEHFALVSRTAVEPEIRIGKRCSNPHECNYRHKCWNHVPRHSIFTIPGIREPKIENLLDENILDVLQVPTTFKLTPLQQRYVDLVKSGIPSINKSAIGTLISELKYPLYFLDFEADLPPIPRFAGMRPFESLPFQFSLHVLERNGGMRHHTFLQLDESDPREAIATELCNCIRESGSVIVYHKSYEKSVLEYLAGLHSEMSTKLLDIRDRLWDQEEIFKYSYFHPNFVGKTSLKVVLETLVPTLSYEDLKIRSGDAAVAVWVLMLTTVDEAERENLKNDLFAYCGLDTLAMVEIHKHASEVME